MSAGNVQWELQKGIGFLFGSTARTVATINAAAEETVTVTVTGAALGDYVLCWSYSVDLELIQGTAYVSAANTVIVQLTNTTAGNIELNAGTMRVLVVKRI